MASAGGPEGGVIWGASADGKNAYFAISDWNPANPEAGGGVVALDIATGKKVWSTPAPKPACVKVTGCSAAQPGPTSLIEGAVFAGSDDGHLRAYATADGQSSGISIPIAISKPSTASKRTAARSTAPAQRLPAEWFI